MMTKRIIIFFTTKLKVKETYYDIEKNMYSPTDPMDLCIIHMLFQSIFTAIFFI
jgi:hypothetical protein